MPNYAISPAEWATVLQKHAPLVRPLLTAIRHGDGQPGFNCPEVVLQAHPSDDDGLAYAATALGPDCHAVAALALWECADAEGVPVGFDWPDLDALALVFKQLDEAYAQFHEDGDEVSKWAAFNSAVALHGIMTRIIALLPPRSLVGG